MAQRRAGFTLLELLVVIGILSLLMAIGVAAFRRTSMRMREDAAAARLDTLIRQARNSALSSGAPAFVELDTTNSAPRAIPWAYRLAGLWHFEGHAGARETSGAFRKKALVVGCKSVEGKIGKGLCMGDSAGTFRGHVDCDADPDFDCEDGGYLEAYICGESPFSNRQYVFHKKNAYSLSVESGGVLVGMAGSGQVAAQNYLLAPRRWTKVAFAWDRRSSRVLVDDAVMGVGPGLKAPINNEPLFIGDEQATFLGRIDEAKILAAVAGEALELPLEAKLIHNAQPWNAIFFAADGSLDLRYHTGPLTIDIVQGEKRRGVTVSMLGLTQRGDVVSEKTEEEDQTKPTAKPAPPPPPRIPLLPAPRKTKPVAPPVFTDEDPVEMLVPERKG